ncbi:MAG: DUF255 domain-containing protein [Sphingobacteriales bacterium]|nr:DUF255 domain-containing protein [Sphingobacteriales bacterium]
MKKIFLSLALLCGVVLWSSFAAAQKADGDGGTATTAGIRWMSIEEAVAASQKNPKKIMVDVYTDWCGWCKKMDKTTFVHPTIVEYVNANYYAVKLDAEQKTPIKLGEETFEYVQGSNGRGYNQFAATLLNGRMSFPTLVFLGEDLSNLSIAPGFKEPDMMDKILHYFAENHHQTTPWADFDKSFQSKIAMPEKQTPVLQVTPSNK